MAAVMSATDSARARDEWRLAIHRSSTRGVANACRLVGIDRGIPLVSSWCAVHQPLAGMQIGQRLQWLKQQIEGVPS